jgi:hypothetical protein
MEIKIYLRESLTESGEMQKSHISFKMDGVVVFITAPVSNFEEGQGKWKTPSQQLMIKMILN